MPVIRTDFAPLLSVKVESQIDMVDTSVHIIDYVLEHHRHNPAVSPEQRSIASDILAYLPENPGLRGFGSAGPEQLDAVEPHGGDAVVLLPGAGDGEVKHSAGPVPAGGAVGGSVVGSDGREAVGVGKIVVEKGDGAGGGLGGERGWERRIDVLGGVWWGSAAAGPAVDGVAVDENVRRRRSVAVADEGEHTVPELARRSKIGRSGKKIWCLQALIPTRESRRKVGKSIFMYSDGPPNESDRQKND
jgi:hypothetical protein